MTPRLETLVAKKLVGQHLSMSLAANRTQELWRSFMARRAEIANCVGTARYSLQVYAPGYFTHFDPQAEFEKWALVEVADFEAVPAGMAAFQLVGGLYAVFAYRGSAQAAAPVFQYIFGTWLPGSGYVLADRPHFEVLGENYRPNHPDSEEEIWIPVAPKPA
ncbi:MAG: GyrI-like domain-containing protein [Janthinobacterium lividum]